MRIAISLYDRKPLPSPAARAIRLRDDGWKEDQHPRGKGGQFSSGGTAHIVASHHPGTGNVTIHGVHSERRDAAKHQIESLKKQYAKIESKYDLADYGHPGVYPGAVHAQQVIASFQHPHAQTKSVPVQGSGGNGDLHIVAEGNHGVGLTLHGAYTTAEAAHAHAERLSREVWAEKGETRSHITSRETAAARREFNADKPPHKQVSREEAEDQSHPAFEKFLDIRYPMDEILPHPGRTKANRHMVENSITGASGDETGRTGIIHVLTHRAERSA